MSLKNSAFFAFAGMLPLTILLVMDFIRAVTGVLNDVVPSVMLVRSLIYLLASAAVTVFFFAFHRAESRRRAT